MMPKNFLSPREKKGDRALWLVGLAAVGLFAFLAAGSLDDARPRAEVEPTAVEAEVEAAPVADEEAGAVTDEASAAAPQRRFGRSSGTRGLTAPEGPGSASVWRTLGSLALIIALIFGGAAFGARFLKKLRMKPQGDKVLELVDVIALGPKRQVFVVSAYGRKIVVGATNESMSVLSEFDQDEIAAPEAGVAPPAFDQRLDRDLARLERPSSARALEAQA